MHSEQKAIVQWSEFSVTLKPSTLGGVGVFATHDIAEGTQVFSGKFSPVKRKIKDIPEEFIKYCVFVSDEECLSPERFDRMEIGWYLNHSDNPNVKKISDNYAIATRNIQAGEEILMDYNQLDEPDHLKESYYFKK